MNMTAQRTRLMIDVEPDTVKQIKIKSAVEGKSMRALILGALADKYPELKPLVDKELKG